MVKKLYASCAQRSIDDLLCVEDWGIGRETCRPFRFEGMGARSEAFRYPIFLHNYSHLMDSAGYQRKLTRLLPTPMVWKLPQMVDVHAMVIWGQRQGLED